MDGVWQDIRFGVRLLLRSPGLLITCVLTLAIGIGANSAVFSVVYGVLLKPLPYPDPDRLVQIYDTQPDCKTCPASFPKYVDWRDQNRVFDVIGGTSPLSTVLTGVGEPQRIRTWRTTASFFRVFGVKPDAGRWFSDDEDKPGGAKVVLLSYGLWERVLARDPNVVGRTLTLDDVPRTVVGVMPKDFTFNRAEAWVPLAMAVDENTRGSHFLPTFGRLKPGISVERAQGEMVALGRRLAAEHNNNHGIDVRAYSDVVIADSRNPLMILLATVAFVLLIACANVANLLLARSAARRKEIAVRTAMGASRTRLARQLLTESVLLACSGGAAGLLLAWAAVRAFVAWAPPVVPRMTTLGLDAQVLAFTCAVAIGTGIVFGLAPVLHARDEAFGDALKDENARSTAGRGSRRIGSALVVAEIALTLVLLVGAGLMMKSLGRLEQQDNGFTVDRVIAFDISLPNARYGDSTKVKAFFDRMFERVRSLPGVVATGATSGLPLYRYGNNSYFEIEGKAMWKPQSGPLAEGRVVDGDYFKALGIPLIKGRLFDSRDVESSRHVAVINQAMADRCWPGENAVGRRFTMWWGSAPIEVIGVVGSVRSFNPSRAPALEVSYASAQQSSSSMTVVVRSSGDPTTLVAAIRREVAAIDPTQPLANVQTMDEVVRTALGRPRLFSTLTSAFAVVAVLLAIVGVYGLIAYAVTQQTREIGVRMALGADTGSVLRFVLGRGVRLALAGVAIGSLGAVGLTRLIRSMLFEVEPTDPAVFAAAIVFMFLAALAACYIPARLAARVSPIDALRT